MMQDIRLGDVTISAIPETVRPGKTPETFFIGATREAAARHYETMEPFLYVPETGQIVMAFQSFVVRTPRRTILIDTCNGEHKFTDAVVWPTRPWLDRFHALGFSVDEIDVVLCTHLHIDHTGWNTRLENGAWVPTFPNATYIFSATEYAYWKNVAETGDVPPLQRDGVWQINCLPIMEAGQARLIDGAHEIDDHVRIEPSPGHSPGHYCVRIRSGALEAVALGDLIHHPLQCREPDWSTRYCWDPVMATESRRTLLAAAAQDRTLLLPTHFPGPTAGYVSQDGAGYAYSFLDEEAS
ncbi:MBL fold metallo-hydrolase [Chachezhania antarctica]|uniref:MBL fold metallo-hydrolase n=1 Tax=Chachezhania antarctica TaxID=2340860 RepID=UPI0019693998|nr:MBL fold metallo-hydrolase [Chachezhania antarctica]|tara:strand:- start:3994 stop:4884 length:891 start_codon:yes stop_codon:yes gene_type:complete